MTIAKSSTDAVKKAEQRQADAEGVWPCNVLALHR